MAAKPVGYPNPAVVCNSSRCTRPAPLWLDSEEAWEYQNGVRLFNPVSQAVKMRVE
ncbi:MAG: hypothetical protein ACYC3S_10670 [Chloroflexota bacterium]